MTHDPTAAIRRAVEIAGSQAKLGQLIGVSQTGVASWLRLKTIPVEHCPAIEKATAGRVTCEQLRPDYDWAYLRSKQRREAARLSEAA